MKSVTGHEFRKYEDLLSHSSCREAVTQYFNKTIIAGDWWPLKEAVDIITYIIMDWKPYNFTSFQSQRYNY